MKKRNTKVMTVMMAAGLLAGSAASHVQAEENAAVKTGLSVRTMVSVESASEEGDGAAQTENLMVAVTVNEEGVIDSCVIDMVQANVTFSAAGELTTEESASLSKNELGDEYGLKQASSIGKEWYEQAAAMADYAVGKTVEELKTGAIDESGMAKDADLASSATIYLGDFVSGIEAAVNNAEHLGAEAGEELRLISFTDSSRSRDASSEADGSASVISDAAAVTMDGDILTSCVIDSVQTAVTFSAEGVTADESVETSTVKMNLAEGELRLYR